jgi:hypothetical protein
MGRMDRIGQVQRRRLWSFVIHVISSVVVFITGSINTRSYQFLFLSKGELDGRGWDGINRKGL